MKRIYLDYAAAAPLSSVAWMAMEPILTGVWGNPSSVHAEGVRAQQALKKAHDIVAQCIGAHADEMVLTSGATEAINLATFGMLRAGAMRGNHVVTAATEHVATLGALKAAGADVTMVPVDALGHVSVDAVLAAITPKTVLVSLMMVNNEIGVIHDIHALGKAIETRRKKEGSVYPLFHTDASQAPNYIAIDVEKLHVDLLTLSSPKVYGPKGAGALYIRRNTPWQTVFGGGKQEGGRRPGTENVANAVGFAAALAETVRMHDREAMRILALREQLIDGLLSVDDVALNGDRIRRVPNNVNISCAGIDGEELVLRLDAMGIAASTGSACARGETPSHALAALGLSPQTVQSSIRFTLGRSTTAEDIDEVIRKTRECVISMRET